MNQVLIMSDSHGLTDKITEIKERHSFKYNIHCGDSELMTNAPQLEDFINVNGNCDWNATFPTEKFIEIGGLSFFITHGHLYNVKANLMNITYRAEEVNADVVCFGHSHIAYAEKINDRLFINPGSIYSPIQFNEQTYAIMQWRNFQEVSVDFYTLSGKQVESLSYKTSFKK